MSTSSTDSFAERYNPFVSPQLEDPYPVYATARREAPVFFSPVLSLWVVSRYDDMVPIFRDHAAFSSEIVTKARYEPTPEAAALLAEGGYVRKPLTVDNAPPDHTRVRTAVNKVFSSARIAKLEASTRATAEELVGGFEKDGRVDLVKGLAYALPLAVMLDLLGLPREDTARIRKWGQAWAAFMWAPLSPEEQLQCARGMIEYMHYCQAQVAARKETLRDDLLSDLIRGQSDDAASLTDLEIASVINDFLFAGHETTLNAIGNGVKLLVQHPDQWADLRANPELMGDAIHELLRMDAPVQVGLRLTTREVEVAGTKIPAGNGVCLLLGSANHDETWVTDGDRLDIRRKKPERHLAFGHGIHFCVGAMLARMELRAALSVLGERLRNPRLAPDATITYTPNLMIRGPARLDLVWDPPVVSA
jgi:cytochrome P450